jgi:hypothetical protein
MKLVTAVVKPERLDEVTSQQAIQAVVRSANRTLLLVSGSEARRVLALRRAAPGDPIRLPVVTRPRAKADWQIASPHPEGG